MYLVKVNEILPFKSVITFEDMHVASWIKREQVVAAKGRGLQGLLSFVSPMRLRVDLLYTLLFVLLGDSCIIPIC